MKSELIRVIDDPTPHPGWFQMAMDAYISQNHGNAFKYTLRFFTWEPPAVSLGANQSLNLIDVEKCRKLGYELVRRPTGGRTLLHKGDVCLSIVAPFNGGSALNLFRQLYSHTVDRLLAALNRLGVEAVSNTFNKATGVGDGHHSRHLCLNTTVRGEMQVKGRKIAGTAQRIYKSSILQQTSILFDGDPGDIAPILKQPKNTNEIAAHLRHNSCSLVSQLNCSLSKDDFIAILRATFTDNELITVTDGLGDMEKQRIESLRVEFDLMPSH